MGTISLQVPQIGQPDTTEDVKVANNFTTIQSAINGNIDTTNLTAAVSQSAGINASGQTVKGGVVIATSQNTGSTTYTTLATPDQVTGIVLSTNGYIDVMYQALWQESVSQAARAAIFVGANQLQVQQNQPTRGPATQAAWTFSSGGGLNQPLFTAPIGLVSIPSAAAFGADVTTGQAMGVAYGAGVLAFELNGTTTNTSSTNGFTGGPCRIFAAAGTYTISVQFKASSGTVTASGRRLYVTATSFS